MLTPQQIQDISFEKALFGGYDMDSVDDILEPLTEDYVTLYKENSVLKSKMRILVEKLEEYRKQKASMQNALLAAQKVGQALKLPSARAGDGAAAAAVVDEGVHGLLQHALFVADDDVRRAHLQHPL